MFGSMAGTDSRRVLLVAEKGHPSGGPYSQAELKDACEVAVRELDTMLEHHLCPHFLPRCKAVVLCSTLKAGLGLAVERGSGLLLVRQPGVGGSGSSKAWPAQDSPKDSSQCRNSSLDGGSCRKMEDDQPGSSGELGRGTAGAGDGPDAGAGAVIGGAAAGAFCPGWSPPCFVTVTGLSAGLTLGVHRANHFIGVMSDAALERLQQGGTLALGAEWSMCLLEKDCDINASFTDLCVVSLTSGLMLDLNVNSTAVRVDAARNRRAYGPSVSTAGLLCGAVALPAVAAPLVRRLSRADCEVVAYAFDSGSEAGEQ